MRLILIFFLLLKAGDTKPAEVVAPPAPALTISFERSNVREKDCVNVELLISNASELELTNATLDVTGPSFFSWYSGRCENTSNKENESGSMFGGTKNPLSLGAISARSLLRRELHFHSSNTIDVGEYNVLFTVPYEWKTNKTVAKSFVSAEKAVRVSFLGNESVAGIPLALAGFIVPGLLFWLIIKVFGASWAIDGLSNQMIYSIMVSIALVAIGAWLNIWDVSSGVSIERLTNLAGAGAILGALAGGGDLAVRKIIENLKQKEIKRQEELSKEEIERQARLRKEQIERQIDEGDSESSLLGKLLELPADQRLEKPIFRLKEAGKRYAGALGAHTPMIEEGTGELRMVYSMVGSFEINLASAPTEQLKIRLAELHEVGQMRELVRLAEENELLKNIDGIREVNKSGGFETEPLAAGQVWRDDEVSFDSYSTSWDEALTFKK